MQVSYNNQLTIEKLSVRSQSVVGASGWWVYAGMSVLCVVYGLYGLYGGGGSDRDEIKQWETESQSVNRKTVVFVLREADDTDW